MRSRREHQPYAWKTGQPALKQSRLACAPADPERIAALSEAWKPTLRPGLLGWLSAVNHKELGKRYIFTGFAFFVAGRHRGAADAHPAGVSRKHLSERGPVQPALQRPRHHDDVRVRRAHHARCRHLLRAANGRHTRRCVSQRPTRSATTPTCSRASCSGSACSAAFAPDGGWFAYTPLTEARFSPSYGMDIYTALITGTELSALIAASELIITIFKFRAPGHVAEPHAACSSGRCSSRRSW